jgi:type IV pilus assembly protein PilW
MNHQSERRLMQRRSLRDQRGLSLVELMIGTVLGLIIIAAVFNVYSGNSRSSRFTEGLQAMQENGRYGVSVLQQSFRLAGYSPGTALDEQKLNAIDMDESSDTTIVVQSQQQYDCNGSLTSDEGGIAINTYTLNSDTQQITCEGNVGQLVMPVVDGVEEFRVLYGVDEDGDPTTMTPQSYVPYDNSLRSEDIVALRFALLVNSGKPIRSRNIAETFVVLDKEVDKEDRLAREVFTSTVLLRNQ